MDHGMLQSRIIRSLRFGKHEAAARLVSRPQLLAACRVACQLDKISEIRCEMNYDVEVQSHQSNIWRLHVMSRQALHISSLIPEQRSQLDRRSRSAGGPQTTYMRLELEAQNYSILARLGHPIHTRLSSTSF
jgi:hypothetical protein